VGSSPDLSGYADLALFDKGPQDIYDAAIAELSVRVPEFIPVEGSVEVQLLEAVAQQVAEAVYAINRIPGAVMQILLQLYGIDRFQGQEPTVDVTFNLADALGHVIPAGTRVRLDLGASLPVVFTTIENGIANPGASTVTVSTLGDRFTSDANSVAVGTALTLVDTQFFVDSAVLATTPVEGVDPETTLDWLNRGSAALGRLSATLALPDAFTDAALENPLIFRAHTLDDWNAGWDPPLGLAAVPSGTGGTLVGGATYRFAVTAITAAGGTLPCASVAATIPVGPNTGSVTLTWTAPAAQPGAAAITGYKVYRGTAGGADSTLGLVATLGVVLTYTATGSGAPGAVPPVANTTGQALAGYVTVAVYGPAGPVTATDKAALQATLDAQALANLNTRVVDATVNAVNVTVHVLAAAGFSAAQITSDVQAAVAALLTPAAWDWDTTLRRNVLISAIGSLPSVAYVETLDVPAADVTLAGVAPLVSLAAPATVTVDGATS
jgi:hypothetical protein